MKRLFILCVLSIIFLCPCKAATYSDMVSEEHWAYEALVYATENGWLNGFEDGTLRINDSLTRAQLAAIMVRQYGTGAEGADLNFADVSPDAWYYRDLQEAVHLGIFMGDGSGFLYPERQITREETFVVLTRVLNIVQTGELSFSDDADISSWAKPSIVSLYLAGYIRGDENGRILPQKKITRAEIAQLLFNIDARKDAVEEEPQQPKEEETDTQTPSHKNEGKGSSEEKENSSKGESSEDKKPEEDVSKDEPVVDKTPGEDYSKDEPTEDKVPEEDSSQTEYPEEGYLDGDNYANDIFDE